MGVVTGERQEGEAHVRGRDAPRRPCSRDLGTHFLFSPFSPGSGSVNSHLDQGMLSHHKRLSSSKTINAQGLRSTPGELATGAPFFLGKK